ncbi:acylamino-acid-releasing enzyme, partial [Trifolium medium]|nr:acylamino-acid-releasing enzyme [Trifolium medium]
FHWCEFSSNSQQLASTVGKRNKSQIRYHGFKVGFQKVYRHKRLWVMEGKDEAILIQQKCVEALKGEAQMSVHLSAAEKSEMNDKAISAIILCLSDKVLIEVARETSYKNFKDTMLYGKEGTITLDEVQSALRTKELDKFKDLKVDDSGECLNVSSREVKTKKDCPQRGGSGNSSAQIAKKKVMSAGALTVTSCEPEKSWIMDSRCSYHICPRKEYFETLELKESGVVRLGNNKACKVQGMGTICLKMIDDRDFLLKKV